MADPVVTKTRPIKRENLRQFLPDQRAVKTFENLTEDVGETLPDAVTAALNAAEAAQNAAVVAQAAADAAALAASNALAALASLSSAQFVAMSASGVLSAERVLTQGANIVLTDGGANGAATIALAPDITGTALNMTIAPLAPGAGQDGGTLTLSAQSATDPAQFGGAIAMACGSGINGGAISITSGAGENVGGDFLLTAGDGTAAGATAGSFLMSAGFTYAAGGTGGSFLMQAGGGDTTGSIYLNTPLGSGIEITDDGAAVKVGLYGAAPVAQSTGWGAPTGTATKTTFNTATVTLPQLAERVKALLDHLLLRGDVGV